MTAAYRQTHSTSWLTYYAVWHVLGAVLYVDSTINIIQSIIIIAMIGIKIACETRTLELKLE